MIRRSGWLALLVIALTACEHPIAVVSPHIEAADLIVEDRAGGQALHTEFNRTWSPSALHLRDDEPVKLFLTALDFRGEPIDISDRPDLSFRMEAEDPAILQWEPLNGFGILRSFGVGETRIRFLIWHINHADFVTPWLDVVITPGDLP